MDKYIVCIDNVIFDNINGSAITPGKQYRVVSTLRDSYLIVCNYGYILTVSKNRFVSEEQYRRLKLEKICLKLGI